MFFKRGYIAFCLLWIVTGICGCNEKSTKELVLESDYLASGFFSDGLAPVRLMVSRDDNKSTKYGYIDTRGKMAINPVYDCANDFSDGLALVRKYNDIKQWGFIDKSGKMSTVLRFSDEPGDFSEGLTRFQVNENSLAKWGYCDKQGHVSISPQFTEADDFSEGVASVKIDRKWGYIDRSGKVVIQPEFDRACKFSAGVARVLFGISARENNKPLGQWGFIDHSGKIVINPRFSFAHDFSEGLSAVEIDDEKGMPKMGFIDRTGRVVIQPQFDYAIKFSEGLARVAIGNRYRKWGFIDKLGRLVIEPKYSWVGDFHGGLAPVRIGYFKFGKIKFTGKIVFIDKTGSIVIGSKQLPFPWIEFWAL